MDLHHLSFLQDLHERTLAAAKTEKAATFVLLECLHRIEESRAHIELSYPTMFEYVHKALGYSESQAYERITAMRLAFKVPEVGEKLKNGDLTLTSVARISAHSKRENLRREQVVVLAEKAVGCSVRQVEKVLAAEAKCPPPTREIIKPVSADGSTLTITIDGEFEALLKEARELESDPTLTIAETLKRALKARVDARKKKKGWVSVRAKARVRTPGLVPRFESARPPEHIGASELIQVPEPNRTHVPNQTPNPTQTRDKQNKRPYTPSKAKQVAWTKYDGQCAWVSEITGARCMSRQSLQLDHRVPFALGGLTKTGNLQYLCAVHNREKGMRAV